MLRTAACLAALALAMSAPLTAQDKPDFSGHWKLAAVSPASPDVPRALTIRQTLVRTNVHGEPMKPFFRDLAVEREFEGGTRYDAYQIGVLGGVIPGMSADGSRSEGRWRRHSVTWQGDALVIETGDYSGPSAASGGWAERREVWSLDANADLRVLVTLRGSGKPATTTVALYRRP